MDEDQIITYPQLKRTIQSKICVPFNDFSMKYEDDEGQWPNLRGDDGDVTELLRCGVNVSGANFKRLKLGIIDCSTPGNSPRPKQSKLSPSHERIPQETSPVQDYTQELAISWPTESPSKKLNSAEQANLHHHHLSHPFRPWEDTWKVNEWN